MRFVVLINSFLGLGPYMYSSSLEIAELDPDFRRDERDKWGWQK